MVIAFTPDAVIKVLKEAKKSDLSEDDKPIRTCREHVLEYWCQPGCEVDHDLAKVVNKVLESWGTDLLEELLCFLGYMDPRSLTEQEVDYVMYHHGFSHPLHCNGKQLYSLNCDDMANLGYGGITGGYDRLRLCDFLLMLLGKDFYPWTLTYPRPGGKVRCCYDCTYGAFYYLQMLISALVIFAISCAMFIFLIPLRCLSCLCLARDCCYHKCELVCGTVSEDAQVFWSPTLFCVWLAAALWSLFAYLYDEIYWLYAAGAVFGPCIIFYSFIIVVDILQDFDVGFASCFPTSDDLLQGCKEFNWCGGFCGTACQAFTGLTFTGGIACIILSQTAFSGDDAILFLVIGVTSITVFWLLIVCSFSFVTATACFHPDVKFERVDGQYVTAEELHPGDHILASNGSWTKVLLTVLHNKEGEKSVFYRFHIDGGHTISMTDKHYQPIFKQGVWLDLPAEEVRVGDILSLKSGALKAIQRIETFKSHGNNIICRDPYIVANGIKASWDIKCTFPHIATNGIELLIF